MAKEKVGNIVRVKITVQGVRPLLQHKFGTDAIPLEKGERTGVAGNDPEEWKRTCMVMPDGQLFIKGTYVFGCLKEAAFHTKRGKGSIQKYLVATLQVEEPLVMLDRHMPKEGDLKPNDYTAPVYLDVSCVRNPSSKARNVRYRLACSAGWRCTFTIMFDKTIVPREVMRSVLNDAGTLVGLADGRNVGNGRFVVESYEELE